MKASLALLCAAVLVSPWMQAAQQELPASIDFMPRLEDYSHMWWAEGFPAHTPGAPWRRVIQTGRFALALDTDTLRIPHFGSVPAGLGYSTAGRANNRVWQRLPPADLLLSLTVRSKTYRCSAGGRWTQFSGPRLIESGRFVQRADVTDLVFTDANGNRLGCEARFETVAWPDWLGLILAVRPGAGESWTNSRMDISLGTAQRTLQQSWVLPQQQSWTHPVWHEIFLADDPTAFQEQKAGSSIEVEGSGFASGATCPVEYDAARGWHRLNLDSVQPVLPGGAQPERQNDAMERVRLVLANPTDEEQTARLLFEKTGQGIRQRIGSPITGVSAILRHSDGQPTGIPVQLSKNWHGRPEGGVHAGAWFHGFSQVRLPAKARIELEFTLVYGHWGGIAAASHAQLCLIGWGSNQHWDESALGAWGESICYEPDQVQARCGVLDVRPLMVRSMAADQPWQWTHNVGGGDFFRLFDPSGKRVPPARMRATYERYGPCLTEVTYAGRIGEGLEHRVAVNLSRTDDLVRGIYRLRLDVQQPVEFSRLVLFQIGADSYSYSGERKMALGNETGLVKEWATQWGGETNRTETALCEGRAPWISLHEAASRAAQEARARGTEGAPGAWANRGIVIREWSAVLGGKPAQPWMVERGVRTQGTDTSTADLVPPPGTKALLPGDFVQATIEHIVVPQFAADYYGPNNALRAALRENENTWRMIHREAVGNDRRVTCRTGTLTRLHPAIEVRTDNEAAEFSLSGGLGYVPITFTDLRTSRDYQLSYDGQPVDQSVHGHDFWQTDYDPAAQRWSRTYNLPVTDKESHRIRFKRIE